MKLNANIIAGQAVPDFDSYIAVLASELSA
jgi:hypothetical protein